MTALQILPIFISAAAAIVAAAAFFLQHVYNTDEVVCVFSGGGHTTVQKSLEIKVNVILSNPGTRTVCLMGYHFGGMHASAANAYEGIKFDQGAEHDFPIIIEPGDIKILRIVHSVSANEFDEFYRRTKISLSSPIDFMLMLRFLTVAGEVLATDFIKIVSHNSKPPGLTVWSVRPIHLRKRIIQTEWNVI